MLSSKASFILNLIRNNDINNYTTLWFKFALKSSIISSAEELDNILKDLSRLRYIQFKEPEGETKVNHDLGRISYIGEWLIL